MPDAEDKELIKRAQAGDTAAFEALVNNYYGIMFKMAFKWCGDRTAAEDITQEACMKLARGIDSFRHDSAFTSWLYRLVINTAKDWFKSQNRHFVRREPSCGEAQPCDPPRLQENSR